jgi:hypothetical protein
MTWVKLDDGFPTHPKVVALSDRAFRVYIAGLCYCAQHLTDGFIPFKATQSKAAGELHKAGLWMPGPGGWYVHDYLVFNPSRERVLKDRERAAERRAKGGRTSGDETPRDTRPVPSPTPTRTPSSKAPPTAGNAAQPITHDQLYLAEQIEGAGGEHLQPSAIQKLNSKFGTASVTSALRRLHGFPPPDPIGSVYAYVESLCALEATA